jgi:signal transduction histidine kinase
MFRSLWFKLVGAFVAVVIITLVIVLSIVLVITQREFDQFIIDSNEAIQQLLPVNVDESTTIVSGDSESSSGNIVENITIDKEVVTSEDPTLGQTIETVEETVTIEQGIREATQSEGVEFLANVQQAALISIALAGLVAILVGTWLFRQITRPMEELRSAAQDLADGDLTVRIEASSQDEVGKVAEAFNHMASEIENQENLRKQMVADVAHELRTPLTVMQGNIEAMIDELVKPDRDELNALHDELMRLTRLVDDLRLLSLADAGNLELILAPVELRQLIETVTKQMTPLAKDQNVALHKKLPAEEVKIEADPDKLRQALVNLISNAIFHTPANKNVIIRLRPEPTLVRIEVQDEGPGIPEQDIPHVFDRFWRGDRSRSRSEGGSGLGLSIVQQIITMHGGEVSLESKPEEGSLFIVTLPLLAGQKNTKIR